MELENAIQYALEKKAILFAGSGFSYGAKTINKGSFKTGLQLRDYLAEKCDVAGTQNSLSSVADYYVDYSDKSSLVEDIRNVFTLQEVAPHHDTILSIPWKRIYTTNYDEVIERASINNNIPLTPVTVSDSIDTYPKNNICVHINGYINKLNTDTIDKEFKLTDRSYDCETLRGLPWFDFMERDFYSAKAIIVIGFSMQSDVDITRILSSPMVASKVVFVSKPGMDRIERNIQKKYATVEEIGVEGFANMLEEKKKLFVPYMNPEYEYSSFIYEHLTPIKPAEITLSDYTHFYFSGFYNDNFFSKNRFGEYEHVVCRKAIDIFMRERHSHKVFLAISSLGNGKSVFCELIRNELRSEDVNVFTFKQDTVDIFDDIAQICSLKKRSVVIIDDYYKHLDKLKYFRTYGIDNITFLLTARQSKLAINYRKLINSLGISENEIKPLYLYVLEPEECEQLATLLTNENLISSAIPHQSIEETTEYLIKQCKQSLSNIVLELFNSSYIKSELETLINNAISDENEDIQMLTIIALCNSVMNLGLSLTEMLSLLNIEYLKLSMRESQIINELFDVKTDTIEVNSSIIARSLLYSIIAPELLKKSLVKLTLAADKTYKTYPKYEELLKALISHSNFAPITRKENKLGISQIKQYYEEIRGTQFCKTNPFYWEQFASICIDARDFPTASQCIENAYRVAESIYKFVPFQICTINADLLLSQLLTNVGNITDTESIINIICDAHTLLIKYYSHEENNHYHIFKVAQKIVTIFNFYVDKFNNRQLSIYIEKVVSLRKYLDDYQNSPESFLYPSTISFKESFDESIERAKRFITK